MLARTYHFEYEIICAMLAALAPGEIAFYGEQERIPR